jgi:predicted RNase H-like HicB family nuclease
MGGTKYEPAAAYKRKKRYTVILEKGRDSWGADVPDLPGCGVLAQTQRQASELIRDAIQLYLDDLRTKDLPVPEPAGKATEVEISA